MVRHGGARGPGRVCTSSRCSWISLKSSLSISLIMAPDQVVACRNASICRLRNVVWTALGGCAPGHGALSPHPFSSHHQFLSTSTFNIHTKFARTSGVVHLSPRPAWSTARHYPQRHPEPDRGQRVRRQRGTCSCCCSFPCSCASTYPASLEETSPSRIPHRLPRVSRRVATLSSKISAQRSLLARRTESQAQERSNAPLPIDGHQVQNHRPRCANVDPLTSPALRPCSRRVQSCLACIQTTCPPRSHLDRTRRFSLCTRGSVVRHRHTQDEQGRTSTLASINHTDTPKVKT